MALLCVVTLLVGMLTPLSAVAETSAQIESNSVDENLVEPDDSTDTSVDESVDESTDESADVSVYESADESADVSDDTTTEADKTVTKEDKTTTKGDGKVTTKSTAKGEGEVTTGLAGADTNFATGKSVMMVGMNWMTGTSLPIGGTTKDDWGIVPAPCSPDISPVAISSTRAACIPLGSRNPDMGLAAYVYWVSNDTYKDADDVDEQPANYPYNEIQSLTAELWDMPKVMDICQGVVEYGGEYSEWDFSFDVFQAGMSGIQTNISKWKSAIDVNIKRIMTEFS